MTPIVKQGRRAAVWMGVACLGLRLVSFLSAQEPKLRANLKGHTNAVVAAAFSPDGLRLASAGGTSVNAPGELKVWDIAAGNSIVLMADSDCMSEEPWTGPNKAVNPNRSFPQVAGVAWSLRLMRFYQIPRE